MSLCLCISLYLSLYVSLYVSLYLSLYVSLCVSLYLSLYVSVRSPCVSLYLERSRLRDGIAMLSGILLGHSRTTYRVALEASKLDVTTAVEWILGA